MKNAKKVVLGLALLMLGILLLTGCSCEHEWRAATCMKPKTCKLCGETEGVSKAHSWSEATCTTPKTCKDCGTTSGSKAEHTWKAATCTAPKTCKECGITSGNKAEHTWKAATCTAPKTCKECGATSGSKAEHTWDAATCLTAKTCKICGATSGSAEGHQWETYLYSVPAVCTVCYETEKYSAYDKIVAYVLEKGRYNPQEGWYEIRYALSSDVDAYVYYLPDSKAIEIAEVCNSDITTTLFFEKNGDSTIPWLFTQKYGTLSFYMYGSLNAYTYTVEGTLYSYDKSTFPPSMNSKVLVTAGSGASLICYRMKDIFKSIGVTAYDMGFSQYK